MENKIKIFDESNFDLNETEIEIVKKINDNIDLFLSSNIIALEKILFYSKSSISRLCQKMGFKNIIEMKTFAIDKKSKLDLYKVQKEEDTYTRINNLIAYNVYTINETLNSIDAKQLNNICNKILSCEKIFCYGIGSSYLTAYEFSSNLLKLGIKANAFNDLHVLLLSLSSISGENLLVIFSKSAAHSEIVFIIETAKKLNIPILLVTNNKEFIDGITYKIVFEDLYKNKRIIATSSKISMLVISDLIYYELYSKIESSNTSLKKANELIKEWQFFKTNNNSDK
ncbi:MurR/RpiR family transcriptional regulator [Malacoplasma iowae]|uniref:MurR/RpiR family transcriptional regulator n=1 Tax=Malacoplasma iowae TaxID=2116 RepID=UPI002A18CCA4|nr:MurR/RpiR family transcriptional regulator [Malacoplasma iowae]WPL38206.1 MurR/RpiR family transcriptional regulator [Malacoplasma iowae]